MNYLHKPKRLLITGRSGTGKTEYYIRYVQAVQDQYARIHVFDPECEFAIRAKQNPVSQPEQLERPEHYQCFDCSLLYPGDLATGLDFYSDYVFECAKRYEGQSLFCCDEVQKITDTDVVSFELSCIIETGRRWEIDTIFVTQQINLVHNRIRNQQTEVVTFRQNDPRAIDWLVNFGFDEDAIRSLQNGDYICRTDQGEERAGNIFKLSGRPTAAAERPVAPEQPQGDLDAPENSDVDNTAQTSSGLPDEPIVDSET